jgi:hypothetical protein
MKLVRVFIVALLLAVFAALNAVTPPIAPNADSVRIAGARHLTAIRSQPWAKDLRRVALGEIRLVQPKASPFGVVSQKAWHARIVNPTGPIGYVLWECDSGQLVEFALDTKLAFDADDAHVVQGVPPLQQFALRAGDGTAIASGCVPTSAASVVGFWIAHGQPQWRGNMSQNHMAETAKRLRSRLRMVSIPDKDGYTDDGMALAGAFPNELATAIQADANEWNVPIVCKFQRFSVSVVQTEIAAGRPVLLSCGVRVPHKPELSWGHEVAGVGWAKIGEKIFVGVLDNFFPTRHADTIRWIAQDAFSSIITVKPKAGGG